MKKIFSLVSIVSLFVLTFAFANRVEAAVASSVQTFSTPGEYTWTVPANVYKIKMKVWGAGGAGGSGGSGSTGFGGGGGSYTEGTLSVVAGDQFTVTVGSGGVSALNSSSGAGGFSGVRKLPLFSQVSGIPDGTSLKMLFADGGAGGLSYLSLSNRIPTNITASNSLSSPTTKTFSIPGYFTSYNSSILKKGQDLPVFPYSATTYDTPITSTRHAGVRSHGQLGGEVYPAGFPIYFYTQEMQDWNSLFTNGISNNISSAGSGDIYANGITLDVKMRGDGGGPAKIDPSFNLIPSKGGNAALGGVGGAATGANGAAPGGGGGGSSTGLGGRGADGQVIIESYAGELLNFGLTDGGDKKINAGDTVTNTITATLTANSTGTGNVVLTLDSIKDSNNNELLGISTTTFKLRQNTFAKGVVVPTETTTLSFDSLPSTPTGQYIVTVSGKYTATTSDTINPKSYICAIKWDPINKGNNQYNGWYFGCSQDPSFNPMIDYYNISKDSTNPFSIQCIDLDDGQCKNSSNPNGYVVSSIGANMLINFRRTLAARECGAGNYTITLPEANATSGFKCNAPVAGNSSIVKTIVKSTTFILNVYNYDLKVTNFSNCSVSPNVQYLQLSWRAASSGIGASILSPSYNIYRTRLSTNTVTKIHVTQADLTFSNDRWYYKDTTYGAGGELFKYTVTYNPTGTVEWAMSNVAHQYSPSPCPATNGGITPNIKLFTKKTTDNSINLNTYNGSTTLTSANTDITVPKGETFDLRWITNLTSDYTCSQITQVPGNTINNIIWGYGYSRNGAATGLSTSGLATGQYILRLSCISGTGSTSLSNTISVTITAAPAINYNLNVLQSGNQCSTADIWIKQTWNAVPGATSYKVTRTKTSPAETITFTTASTQNIETYPTFTTGATYSYTVAAIIGGVEQTPSATTTIVSPAISCPPVGSAAIKLFIKRSNDATVNLSALTFSSFLTTANTEASVLKGDTFDLRWISNLTPDYNSCTQATVKPNGQTDNTIWQYGAAQNGFVTNNDTTGISQVGQYILNVSCTNGISVVSNTVKLNVIDYGLSVSTSGDKCLVEQSSLAITENWNLVPNATSYKITRTSPSLPTVTYSPLATNQKIEASSTSATFNYNTQYTYTVAATISGVEQIPSLPVTVTSPTITSSNCPQPTLLLEIKKGTDPDSSYSGSASITVGDAFYLRWTSANTNQTYTCANTTTKPDGTSGNSIWSWGNTLNGTSASLSSTGQPYGQYNFKMDCTGNSDSTVLSSNTVSLDMAPATIVVNPSTTSCPGGCGPVWPPNNPAPPPVLINPQVRLFVGSQSGIQSKTISDLPSDAEYKVKKGNSAKIKFITSLPASYNCNTRVLKPDGSPIEDGKLQWSANRTVNENVVQNINTSNVEPGLYTFTLICPDTNSSDIQLSNDQKLQISESTIKEK